MNRKILAGCLSAALVVVIAIGLMSWKADVPPPGPEAAANGANPPPAMPPPADTSTQTTTAAVTLAAEMSFRRLSFDADGDRPEACLEFSLPLTDSLDVRYADYIRLRPAASSSLRVDGTRLCISGLVYGAQYSATIMAGLPALSGARTGADEHVPISMFDRPPLVAFTEGGFILPRTSTGLSIQTVNVDRLDVRVLHIGDRQAIWRLGALRTPGRYSHYDIETLTERYATEVWRGEMVVQNRRNEAITTVFPIGQAVPQRKPGLYVVTAQPSLDIANEGRTYRQVAAHYVVETNIALSTLSGADGLHVVAKSLESAKPLPGVRLSLIARGNDELANLVSDESGHVVFPPGLLRGQGGAQPTSVMAFSDSGDFAILDLNRPAFDLSDRGVSGRDMPGAYDAYLYTDRGIYRPGESVHIAALLRDQLASAVVDTPVTLVVTRPNGGEFKRFTLREAKAGAFLLDVELPDTASRGLWNVAAFVDPTGQPVGRIEFDVQDFIPQRLKVTANLAAATIEPNNPIALSIDAAFLYGAPAAGLSGEVLIKVERDPQPFAAAGGYMFGLINDAFRVKDYEFDIAETDAQGHTTVDLTLNGLPRTSVPLLARIDTGLFEPGGRSTRTKATVPLRTATSFVGIKPLFSNGRVRLDTEAAFEIQAFDADGRPIAAERLDYAFFQEVVSYDYAYNEDRWKYNVSTRDRSLQAGTVAGAADRPAILRLRADWGRYRLEVRDRDRGAITSVRFAAGWQASPGQAERPDVIDMTVDKPAYAAGDTVKVHIVPPFAGQLTLAVATDRVHELRHLSVPAEGTTVEIETSALWGPGAYLLASIQQPVGLVRARDPVRAVGVAWAGMDMSACKLTVDLQVPAMVRPQSRLSIPVSVQGADGETVWLTLAAVDEGILQLTQFRSPDPAAHYFSKRRLGLDLRDDYGRLLDGNAGLVGVIRAGGDSYLNAAGLPAVPTRTVALFSGAVAIDRNGKATVDVEIPDFAGQLRLMAVAFGKTRVGSGEARVHVRHPVVADVALPRFLAPGDVGRLTLSLHNVEGPTGAYVATLQTEGPIAFDAPAEAKYELSAGDRRVATTPLRASGEGIGVVRLAVSGPQGFAVQRE